MTDEELFRELKVNFDGLNELLRAASEKGILVEIEILDVTDLSKPVRTFSITAELTKLIGQV